MRATPEPRPDRAPTAVLVLSALIVVALVAGGVHLVRSGGRSYPSEWDERVAPLAEWTAKERNLEFEHPVEVHFLTEEEFTADVTGADLVLDEEAQAELDAEMADQVATLRALGFIAGDLDLMEASDSLMGAGTLAYYSPATEEVFVRGTELTPAVRATLVHELVHVLQDQHFDLNRLGELGEEPGGRAVTLRALAEGDAGRIEDLYVAEFDEEDRAAYAAEMAATGETYEEAVGEEVPAVLEVLFAGPYVFGPALVGFLDQTGGDDAIDAALTDPPTEFVLFDPPLHDTPRAELLTTTVQAPSDAEVLVEDTFGPSWWYLLLATRVDPAEALAAVHGIGGDAYVSFRRDDAVCVRIAATTHSADEADTLAGLLESWTTFTSDGASVSRDATRVELQSCDEGREEPVGEMRVELLTLPVLRTVIELQIRDEGATPAEARCFAEGLIGAFSIDELNAEAGQVTPEDQAQIQGIMMSCL